MNCKVGVFLAMRGRHCFLLRQKVVATEHFMFNRDLGQRAFFRLKSRKELRLEALETLSDEVLEEALLGLVGNLVLRCQHVKMFRAPV